MSEVPPLVSIVPRLPPSIDGVGDYALSLAQRVAADFRVRNRFIVGDLAWQGAGSGPALDVVQLRERTTEALASALPREPEASVLLHYGGYAYARRGCPFWLVEALERWREGAPGRRLLTVFHELYASGPPWTSSFWLSTAQRRLAARLARLSDDCFTSLECYADTLRRMGGERVTCRPVFSCVGEQRAVLPLAERKRWLVVFGVEGRRELVYRRSARALVRACRELEIEEIWDIGRPLDFNPGQSLGVRVVQTGALPSAELGEVFSKAFAGVIDYPAEMLGKSTIFASYCAYGLTPLVAGYGSAGPANGLREGEHYVLLGQSGVNLSNMQRVSEGARRWYESHRLDVHARALGDCLSGADLAVEESLVSA